MNRFLIGVIAGVVATVPMTLLMNAWRHCLPEDQRYPLPPHEITRNAADDANAEELVDTPEEAAAASLAAHFGYGGGAGAVYALLSRPVPLPPLVRGSLFGAALWTIRYLGIMPAVGWHRSATKEPAGRNILMLTANILWGAVTGFLCDVWENPSKKPLG